MMKKYIQKTALVAVAELLFASIIAFPVAARSGLTVGHSGGKGLNPDVLPGESYIQNLLAGIGETDVATDVAIEVFGYGENRDGSITPIPADLDNSPFSACKFIQPNKSILHLESGETKLTNVTIQIPQDVGAGGRYAIIRFSTVPPEGSSVKVISAIILPIAFSIKDSQFIHSGEILGVTADKAESGKPVDIFTTIKNTGNHHFKIKSQIEIYDSQARLIDTLYTTDSSPIPGVIRDMKTIYTPKGELSLGIYSVKSRVMLEDGTLLGVAIGNFEIGKPYVPPPPPAGVSLNPGSASKLETKNGEISISFSKEAVLAPVEVSLRSYPPEQLPSAPAGYLLTSNCFRVDGLTGLLANEALVTVKYTQVDLDKAKGDASALRLARWDEAKGQWTVLDTRLDKSAMTLSASTNQFSIWAVMVAPPAGINWFIIGGIAGGGLILTSVLVLFVMRRRRG